MTSENQVQPPTLTEHEVRALRQFPGNFARMLQTAHDMGFWRGASAERAEAYADARSLLAEPNQDTLQMNPSRCKRCGGEMRPGTALAQSYTGSADFPGAEVVTMSPGGPGHLVVVSKCSECGYSVRV